MENKKTDALPHHLEKKQKLGLVTMREIAIRHLFAVIRSENNNISDNLRTALVGCFGERFVSTYLDN